MADELITTPCYTCKLPIHMSASVDQLFRSNREAFYCLNGHPNAYVPGKSEEQKLREQVEEERRLRQRAEQNVAMWQDDARRAREDAEHQKRRANGYKGHATKITKRAKAGVCPCCNRTFQQLARHMATQHPTFTPLDLVEPANKAPL